jgi:RNA polymerase sigma factor (sigma-70 family)
VPFSSWLFRIAANLITDRGRRSGRVVNLGDDPIPEFGIERRHENLPALTVERWERTGWLLNRIANLPADQQQAIQLRFWEDRTVTDVAARMGRSDGAAKQILRRALNNLRVEMERDGGANV